MKKYIIICLLFLCSCVEQEYEHIGQEIIDGKVSATKEGVMFSRGKGNYPKIWVQNATNTKEVDIPFEYEGRWKVGDSCLLIIEKYKLVKSKK